MSAPSLVLLRKFIQSITEQAARVPVTVRLNAQITGNLPIHCVFQLLKTYAFNKNKVQIKVSLLLFHLS